MKYLIWSFEHNAWWKSNRLGYTPNIDEAGRYNAAEAGQIVIQSVWNDEVAVLESIAQKMDRPKHHPYRG